MLVLFKKTHSKLSSSGRTANERGGILQRRQVSPLFSLTAAGWPTTIITLRFMIDVNVQCAAAK